MRALQLRFGGRTRAQGVVEFGIIAILFTLLMFAIVDFGMLLNEWLSVSSEARLLARDEAVGLRYTDLKTEAQGISIPGVGADAPTFTSYCCDTTSAVQVTVTFNSCPAAGGACAPVTDGASLDSRFHSGPVPGTCTTWSNNPPTPCPHPAAPSGPSALQPRGNPGDTVTVTVTAAGAQVVTPLVRPFFTNTGTCVASALHCYVPLSSTVTMRFEGEIL